MAHPSAITKEGLGQAISELVGLLGRKDSSAEMRVAVETFQFKIKKYPPATEHYVAAKHGFLLLVEGGTMMVLDLYVRPVKPMTAFAHPLPFGLDAGMNQQQVHALLGEPRIANRFVTTYVAIEEIGASFSVSYARSSQIKSLTFHRMWA